MAERSTIELGNALISLVGENDPFNDGRTTGYLEFYDERHRPAFPLSSQIVSDYLTMIVNEPSVSALWRAGRISGWMEALMENAPQTFKSDVLAERITALQEV